MGLQFIETALLEIPKHGYYYSKRHETERLQNSREAARVCQLLQEMVGEEQVEEQKRLQIMADIARVQASASYDEQAPEPSGWGDLSMFGDALSICCVPSGPSDEENESAEPGQKEEQKKQEDLDFSLFEPTLARLEPATAVRDQSDLDFSIFEPSDARIKPANSVRDESEQSSGYSPDFMKDVDFFGESHDLELERALFLSGLEVPRMVVSEESSVGSALTRPRKSETEIDIAVLRACYHEDFDVLRSEGRVRISTIRTYQGRLNGSVNGCTVIAPLLCIRHFQRYTGDYQDPGLLDSDILQVIDVETPALLPEVRTKLGLTKDALIIPADVHDILLERELLVQDQFVTVCGGNILNEAHLNELIAAITNAKAEFTGKKIAATVFFHEHVIAILKLERADGQVWYDLIDSLPSEYTLSRPVDSSGSLDEWKSEFIPYAVRIRCLDEEALRATLRWYACSKFHDENCEYIDMYAWVDDEPDFDPRVFQAFVWAEA